MLSSPPLSTDVDGGGTAVRTISVAGTKARIKFFAGAGGLPQEVGVLPLRSAIITAFSSDSAMIDSMQSLPAVGMLGRLPLVILGDPATVKVVDDKVTNALVDWVGSRRVITVIAIQPDVIWSHKKMEVVFRLPSGSPMPKVCCSLM